jgi:hypothetical protein
VYLFLCCFNFPHLLPATPSPRDPFATHVDHFDIFWVSNFFPRFYEIRSRNFQPRSLLMSSNRAFSKLRSLQESAPRLIFRHRPGPFDML